MDCNDEHFKDEILKLSEDNQNFGSVRILKLYSGAREIERTERILRCEGEARLSQGENHYVVYYIEIDRDNDQFIGYEIGDAISTPTPAPALGSREIPVPFGNSFETSDSSSSEHWEVRVVDTLDATRLVLDENPYNDPPKEGNQFYIVRVRAKYLGSDSAKFDGSFRLRALGLSGVVYTTFDDRCGVIPDEIVDRELFNGGAVEGNVCWQIASSDMGSLIMFLEPPLASFGGTRSWFELRPPENMVLAPVTAPVATQVPATTVATAPSTMVNDITITMAISEVSEQFGDFEAKTFGTSPTETQMGFYDHLLVHDGVNPMAPFASSEWSINSAGNEVTLVIREDLKVNTPDAFSGQDFGYINAHDVAWNMNRQNAVVNPNLGTGYGELLGSVFGEAVAVDDYTVKVPLVTHILWALPITEFELNDTSIRLDSKNAFEAVGPGAIQLVPVGSGPFTIGEWVPNSHGEVHAVPDHWIEPPHVSMFRVVQAPEITTRMAMMQTGEADIGSIDLGRLRELESKGLKFITTMSDKDTTTLSTIWPGNLWTDLNAKTQEGIEPWLSAVYSEDYAWLGCPWVDLCSYEDTNNPDGMSDMEQARLVRWALSHAIDRQRIVDVLQVGLGTPIYTEMMGPKFPGWRPERTVTAAMMKAAHEKYDDGYIVGPGTEWIEYQEYDNVAEPDYEWPWEIPTDRAEAERLLDLAGFPDPDGPGGEPRFEIKMNRYRCETGDICLEQVDAVAADWEAIGVRVELLNEAYGGVIVPRMRDRTQAFPVVKNCSVETANYPFDWPPPPADSTFSRPAWGCAFESKFLDYMYININNEWDKQKREDLHLDMVDYYYYWQLYSGLVQVPRGVASNPETVDSWQSRSNSAGFWGRPQHIVPAR